VDCLASAAAGRVLWSLALVSVQRIRLVLVLVWVQGVQSLVLVREILSLILVREILSLVLTLIVVERV